MSRPDVSIRNSNTYKALSPWIKVVASLAIVVILAWSFIVYFIFQSSYEQQIKHSIFEQQKERQVAYAKAVVGNIRSDLDSLMKGLEVIALSKPVQDRLTTGEESSIILKEFYEEASTFAKIDGVSLIDETGKIVNYYVALEDYPDVIGQDVSGFETYTEALSNLPDPTYSYAYRSPFDGAQRISLSHPIYDPGTGEYMGLVNTILDTRSFLSKYDNVDDITSQYIAFYDGKKTVVSSPLAEAIGLNFYDPLLRQGSNPTADQHFEKVFSGQSSVAVFSYRASERINAGEPIILNGNQVYSVFIVTPTASIYAQIDSIIASQRAGFYILQGATAGAIGIALFFLLRWSGIVERAVKERTFELQDANEELKLHDKLQREFINIAAHELRTPIQPILGSADIMRQAFASGKEKIEVTKAEVDLITRNAQRLEKLSADILTASRIEGGRLQLNLEEFDIEEKIRNVVNDVKDTLPTEKKHILLTFESPSIVVQADKSKIFEVLSNLLMNAFKFTKDGSVCVTAQKKADGQEIIVKVVDTGKGIDPDMMPNLFTKFVAKSDKGTGLGLYISKSIVEAHGGKIWAENNPDGKGAIFTFTLPIKSSKEQLSSTIP